jgi:NADH-quinone oxidoreductase subunit G
MRRAAARSAEQGSAVVIFGDRAVQHPQVSLLRAAARFVAAATGAAYKRNSWRRERGGARGVGRHARTPAAAMPRALLAKPPRALLHVACRIAGHEFLGAYERRAARPIFHVYIGAYACNGVKRTAHAVLPVGLAARDRRQLHERRRHRADVAAGSKLPATRRSGGACCARLGLSWDSADSRSLSSASCVRSCRVRSAAKFNLPKNPRVASVARRADSGFVRRSDGSRCIAAMRRAPFAALQAHPLTARPRVGLNPQTRSRWVGERRQRQL